MRTVVIGFTFLVSVLADECSDFCNRRLDSAACAQGSYCKNNYACHGLFWIDSTRSQICVLGFTEGCSTDIVVTCADARRGVEAESSLPASSTSSPIVSTTGQSAMTTSTLSHTSPNPSSSDCPGHRWGMFTWDMSYYRRSNPQLLDFLRSSGGREYACGDIYINVADYSSPGRIPDQRRLVDFIKAYRTAVGFDSVVYLTYGDVTDRNGPAMITFTNTFFDWAETISPSDAELMGAIGISYDVERLDAEVSRTALLLCRDRRLRTAFGEANLRIQHTLDGDVNVLSTRYVMQYADSALAMLYSNTASGLTNSIRWLLTTQCQQCLDDRFAIANYRAKISIMVEASCRMGRGCSEKSMCVYDDATEGAFYIESTFTQTEALIRSSGLVTDEQFARLFDQRSMWVIHNFEWFRCYAPFDGSLYPSCTEYHREAAGCRGQ